MVYIRNPFREQLSLEFEPLIPRGEFSRDYGVKVISEKLGVERYKASLLFTKAINAEEVLKIELSST